MEKQIESNLIKISSEPTSEKLELLNRYWRAVNYIGAAQLYLKDNVLLKRPLKAEDIKPRLLGHWGTQPGLNLIYTHLNRLIKDTNANILMITGPGHGAPAILANLYIEGSMHEYYNEFTLDLEGLENLIKAFSWPFGNPSHLVPGTPGQIQEGGELGYCLEHAYGAVLDNPDLIAVCVVGDGEAETGALATSWHSNKFINPANSGSVLPILHLNGYKLSGPTIFARMPDEELIYLFKGYGYKPVIVSGDEPMVVHYDMWKAIDNAYNEIVDIKLKAESGIFNGMPHFPMIILRTPKGWTCPKSVDGIPIEDTFHSHQLPVKDPKTNEKHLKILEQWLLSYKPVELFDDEGKPCIDIIETCPTGKNRIGLNAHANGGELLIPLKLPDYRTYGVDVNKHGKIYSEGTRVLGGYLRDVFKENDDEKNFRLFCPDETTSNRLEKIFEFTQRAFMQPIIETDEFLSRDGRVIEMLSEQNCQGWLEGYLLTGRHGLFPCYEAFTPIVDSMLNQYAKWLKVAGETYWRKPLASLNYLLTSHVWRQDHNGYTHQIPSFINNVINKKSSVSRIYFPPDANCLLSVTDHCLRSMNYINLIVASKQENLQWLNISDAEEHCRLGASIWHWAGSADENPDVILASAGDVPTTEIIAASQLLQKEIPDIKVRVVNVVDLYSIISNKDHQHGMDDHSFYDLYGSSTPVIFAFHGYPLVIHELLHHRQNPGRFHVHGYIEEGRTTTPFDMLVLNKMSRFDIAIAALERCDRIRSQAGGIIDKFKQQILYHSNFIKDNGVDMPEITGWKLDY